jgi:hypothetical protein
MSKDTPNEKEQPTLTEIQNWLVAYMTEMIADLEDWLGRDLDRTLIYDYPTLEKLAKQVSQS